MKILVVGAVALGLGLAVGQGYERYGRQGEQQVGQAPETEERTVTQNPHPLLDPMRAIRPQSDFVVYFRPLRLELEAMAKAWEAKGVTVAIQMEYLNTGSHVSINQNYRMVPASLTKVPVAMMVMNRVEEGKLKLDQVVKIEEADRDSKWGELYQAPVGTELPLAEVIRLSLVESDNTAHRMLYRLVGVEDASELSAELNLEDLFDEQGRITAREYARLLRSLYTSSYLEPANSQQLLGYLTQDQVVKFLIRGLGEGTAYAHKFGESASIYSYLDAGIVYAPNRPYILVVMVQDTQGTVKLSREQAGEEIFEKVARLTYNYVTQGKLE